MSPDRAARRDRWSAVALAALAVAYLLIGRDYPLDTLAAPGPGVFPLATGVALLALSLYQLAAAGRRPAAVEPAEAPRSRPALAMAAALIVYAAALPRLGFLVTSFALVLVAARLMGLAGWWRPSLLALGVTLACRVIFVTWLRVPLP
jgi:hypothetical protein